MAIIELEERPGISTDKRTKKALDGFLTLLKDLRERNLPDETIKLVNQSVGSLNQGSYDEKAWRKALRNELMGILKMLEKKHKLVPTNHYRNQWLAIGMATFGIPFGVAFGAAMGNMAFLGIGLPIGMAIGIAIGADKDRRAAREGRQLNFSIG